MRSYRADGSYEDLFDAVDPIDEGLIPLTNVAVFDGEDRYQHIWCSLFFDGTLAIMGYMDLMEYRDAMTKADSNWYWSYVAQRDFGGRIG